MTHEEMEHLWGRFVNHYWDSFEGEKSLILKHVRGVLDYHAKNSDADGLPIHSTPMEDNPPDFGDEPSRPDDGEVG